MDLYECAVIVGCGLAFGLLSLFSLVWHLFNVFLILLVDVPLLVIKWLYQSLVIVCLQQQLTIAEKMREAQEDE